MLRHVALVVLLIWPLVASAQQVTGSITGSVVDQTGSAIAGATVNLVSEQTGAVHTVSSDPEGNFVFTAVPPGIYTVSVEQSGFKKFQKQGLELTPGGTLAVGNVKLEVGAVSESVTVRAEGAMVQTATGERAGIVTSDEIKDLTVINRDFTTFAELQPGVVINVSQEVQTFTGQRTFNALGGRTTGNNVLIDGVPAYNSNQGNFNTTLSLDATQTIEVKVANFDAEFGRNQGVTILAVSKGGTQQFHGNAYYYDRNEALNANNFFNNKQGLKADGSLVAPRQKYRISNGGGTFGGPLRIPHLEGTKGKLFFFVASEEIREVRPKAAQYITVPTAIERKGDFSQSFTAAGRLITVKDPLTGVAFPGNVIPTNRILQSTQNYLNLPPLPNFTNTAVSGGNYNYVYQESLDVPKRINTGRLDYNMSSRTTMYARFNYWWEDQSGAAVSAGNSAWGWFPDHYQCATPSGVVSLTHIVNPTTVLQATMGFQRFNEAGSPLSQEELAAKSRTATGVNIPQFHPEINPYNVVPAASFGGVTSTSSNSVTWAPRFPLRGVENTFNWNGTLNKVVGGHTLKAGIYAERWRAMKGFNAGNFAGTMAFGTDSNNLSGDTGNAYLRVVKSDSTPLQPFQPDQAPIRLFARARRIPGWITEDNGLVGEVPLSPTLSHEPIEEIPLIPMGAARLRVSAFPVAGHGPEAKPWSADTVMAVASHCWPNDTPRALFDGIVPRNSADATVPRFSWWDRTGTREWVEYYFREPRKIGRSGVYWADDSGSMALPPSDSADAAEPPLDDRLLPFWKKAGGGLRIPTAWRLVWWDGSRWREVSNGTGYRLDKNRFNEVELMPVVTRRIRLEAELQPRHSAGVLEWRVMER